MSSLQNSGHVSNFTTRDRDDISISGNVGNESIEISVRSRDGCGTVRLCFALTSGDLAVLVQDLQRIAYRVWPEAGVRAIDKIEACPRCDENHLDLLAYPLGKKSPPLPDSFTHWAICPTTHTPIFIDFGAIG
jgi:hypothetical protein